jgi:hypothetical protein
MTLLVPSSSAVGSAAPISVTVSGGPAQPGDWVGLFRSDAAPYSAPLLWWYMNNTTTQPAVGIAAATLTFNAPSPPGTYEFRFASPLYLNNATSTPFIVQSVLDQVEFKVFAYGLEPQTRPSSSSFIVGHPTRGVIGILANTGNQVVERPSVERRTDLTCFVTGVQIGMGKSRPLESFPGSTATIKCESSDRRFDPLNEAGAYNGGVGKQLFTRGVPIVVMMQGNGQTLQPSTDEFPLFSGWIDEIEHEYSETGEVKTTTVKCVDAFDMLGRFDQFASDTTEGFSDTCEERIIRWCQAAGVLPRGKTAFATPGPTVVTLDESNRYGVIGDAGGPMLQSTTLADNALTGVKQAAASSTTMQGLGYVLCDAFGRVRWGLVPQLVPSTNGSYSPWVISDEPGPAASTVYRVNPVAVKDKHARVASEPTVTRDDRSVRNVVRFIRKDGTWQVATNPETIQRFGEQSYERTDLLNLSDDDVSINAQYHAIVYGKAPMIVTVTVNPLFSDGAMAMVLNAQMYDQCDVVWSRANLRMTGYILGVNHTIEPNERWSATYTIAGAP